MSLPVPRYFSMCRVQSRASSAVSRESQRCSCSNSENLAEKRQRGVCEVFTRELIWGLVVWSSWPSPNTELLIKTHMSSLTLHYSWGHVYESYTLHMQIPITSNRLACWPTFLLLAVLLPFELKTVFRWKYKLFVNSAPLQEMADAARCHSSQCRVTGAHLRQPFHGSLIACFILNMWGAHTDFAHQALALFHVISQHRSPSLCSAQGAGENI